MLRLIVCSDMLYEMCNVGVYCPCVYSVVIVVVDSVGVHTLLMCVYILQLLCSVGICVVHGSL